MGGVAVCGVEVNHQILAIGATGSLGIVDG